MLNAHTVAKPNRNVKIILILIAYKQQGSRKNEGFTRNFLGRGNAAKKAMNFIVIKFEQIKRAMTTSRTPSPTGL